jgi:thiamine biosynthesis lipoprotein
VRLGKEGMKITLGAIAKGYAVDQAIDLLKSEGIQHALIDAGGDIRAIGRKSEGPWGIALQNPRNSSDYVALIPLDDQAVATSGDYERFFDENKSFHHIIDPKTGYSATSLISVTVIAKNLTHADALATTIFVMGPEKGIGLLESLPDVEGLLITRDRKVLSTEGFPVAIPYR